MEYINVNPSGSFSAEIALIGEQPAAQEALHKVPFVGNTGRKLDEILLAAKVSRNLVYIDNAISMYGIPLSEFIHTKKVHYITYGDPTPLGKTAFAGLRDRLSRLPNLKVVIPMGNVALHAVLGMWEVTKRRGSIYPPDNSRPYYVVPTIHPSTLLPPKEQFLNRALIIADIKKAISIATGIYVPSKRELLLNPSYKESIDFLGWLKTLPRFAYDIEVDCVSRTSQLSCISLGYKGSVMSIPFIDETGNRYTYEEEVVLMNELKGLLEDTRIVKGGQNLIFDSTFLANRYNIKPTLPMDDTMILQGIVMPDYKKSLDFIASLFTDIPYYKDDGKIFFRSNKRSNIDWMALWRYNALDTCVVDEALDSLLNICDKQNNISIYHEVVKMLPALSDLMNRGILVDRTEMEDFYKASQVQAEDKLKQLIVMCKANGYTATDKLCGSKKQLQEYFIDTLHYPPLKTLAGKEGFDDLVLSRLARGTKTYPASQEAKLIQDVRRLRKLSSTYADINMLDDDNRIRCSYNPVGTRFSRLSSSKNIFGSGTNLQNWNREMMAFLKPDKGYFYFGLDLAQAENKIVAYLAGCKPMIEAFENDIDMHRRTGSFVFGCEEKDVSDEPYSSGFSEKSQRDIGKQSNHAFNYGMSYVKFGLYYGIPQDIAKKIWEAFHLGYPEIKNVFHTMVEYNIRKYHYLTNLLGRRTVFYGDLTAETFRKGYDCIPQSTVGDIINQRGMNHYWYTPEVKEYIQLMLQIHDQLGFQAPLNDWKNVANAILSLRKSLETPLKYQQYDFILNADITISTKSMYKKHGVEWKGKNFPYNVNELADKLEALCKENLNLV